MHPEARDGLARMLKDSGLALGAPWRVLDLGGRDINGSVRDLLPHATWTGLDVEPGPGVDLVHDATRPWPIGWDRYDIVVCTEVMEHVQLWRCILQTASEALRPGGPQALFVTCASDGRHPHGASGAASPAPGEWYRNVSPQPLLDELEHLFREATVTYNPRPGDAYAWAQGVKR
ncbi:class I SAM-dependent methyltransferase [Streptomyces sparsogenes]|uniref:class I SAM-dependent methyltransferase n=1 Tax=Streptomyces sparsogenes TaxID=67365 RepID=UPI003404C534